MAVQAAIENGSADRVTDLHVWSIGHGIFAAEISPVSDNPKAPEHYKSLISPRLKIVHTTIAAAVPSGFLAACAVNWWLPKRDLEKCH